MCPTSANNGPNDCYFYLNMTLSFSWIEYLCVIKLTEIMRISNRRWGVDPAGQECPTMVTPLDKVTKDFTAHTWQLGFLPSLGLSSSSMSLLEKQQLGNCPWLWFDDLIPTDLNWRDWFGAVFAILLQSTHRMQGVFYINQDYSEIKESFCLTITLGRSLSLRWSNPKLIILHSCFIPFIELKAVPNLGFELWRESWMVK